MLFFFLILIFEKKNEKINPYDLPDLQSLEVSKVYQKNNLAHIVKFRSLI
jgi:hypothetical protein